MFRTISTICAAAMAISLPLAAPAVAMPAGSPAWQPSTDVVQAQFGERGRGGYERRGNRHYFNGHRGYRQHRRGYRQYNGFWFPPAAFIAGAIVGGAIANQPPRARAVPRGQAHVEWCYNRYRSYREWDNTFQPYNGPRQECYSPYS